MADKEENNKENKSDVARFRKQQREKEEAARRGLQGISSGGAKHDAILRKVQQATQSAYNKAKKEGKTEEEALQAAIDSQNQLASADKVWCEECKGFYLPHDHIS